MRDEAYERQILEGEKAALAWLRANFPDTAIDPESLPEWRDRRGFRIRHHGKTLYTVRFRVDFLADRREEIGAYLDEHGLRRMLEASGGTPVVVP